jgi:hypothetical protein
VISFFFLGIFFISKAYRFLISGDIILMLSPKEKKTIKLHNSLIKIKKKIQWIFLKNQLI